jgi:hypothetical protein
MSISRKVVCMVVLLGATSSFSQKSQVHATGKYDWFSFQWQGDMVSNRYFDKIGIIVPVTISQIKGNTGAQFDLGSDESMLYGNSIKNYFATPAQFLSIIDTAIIRGGGANYRSDRQCLLPE